MKPRLALFFSVLAVWVALHYGVLSYVLRNPSVLGAAVFSQGLEALARLAVVVWLLAAAAGLGRRLLRPLALPFADQAERLILEASLGLGAVSYILFALGLLKLWTPAPLAVLFGLMTVNAWAALRSSWSKPAFPTRPTWTQALFAGPILLAVLYGFITANAPPTEWDSLAVHLELPKLYAQFGALRPLTELAHGFDPMVVEMLYVPALVFKDPALPAMISLLFELLMAAALWVCGRRLVSRPAALAAAELFLSQPAVTYVGGTPGTDFGVGLFAMLAFWCAWRALETETGAWLVLSGALSGLAAVSKTTGVFLAASLACVLAFAALRRHRALRGWLPGWAAAAAVCAAPWFLRTLLYKHNPVWPYLPQVFGGGARDVYIFARVRDATLEGVGTGWRQLLLLPYHLIFEKPEVFRHSSRELLIPFLSLGALGWRDARKDPFARWTLAYAGVFTLLWFSAVQNWRYFIPLTPWLCLLTCGWAARAWRRGGGRRLAAGVLAVGFIAVPAMSANNALFAVLGLKPRNPDLSSEQAYLGRSLNSYAAMDRINRAFPADAKILLFREVRPFYLDRDFLVGDPQNEMLIRYEELATPEELYRRLRELGITAVLVNPRLETFSPQVPAFRRAEDLLRTVLQRYAAAPADVDGVLLYSWRTP